MIITPENDYKELDDWLKDKKKIFLVCGNSIDNLKGISSKLKQISLPIVRFSEFNPNPLYDSVVKGVRLFREEFEYNGEKILVCSDGLYNNVNSSVIESILKGNDPVDRKCFQLIAFGNASGGSDNMAVVIWESK